MIDWNDSQTHLLLNPRMPETDAVRLRRLVDEAPSIPGHIWLAASGSSGSIRMVALSKRAMLHSAAAVNAHVAACATDTWMRVLPDFHVGGLAIEARAQLTGSRVLVSHWNPRAFVQICIDRRVTLSSLVPAQVNDLVTEKLAAPPAMRAVFVGGGRLSSELFAEAARLGWRLLPSFGMTECASQIATAALSDEKDDAPPLVVLPHIRVRELPDGRLAFAGESLFSGYAMERNARVVFEDPREDGWFASEDVGRVRESNGRTILEVEGRSSDFFKIGGESVSMARLDGILEGVLRSMGTTADAALIAVEDDRLGHILHIVVDDGTQAAGIRDAFDARVLPFERARDVHVVNAIPRSPLGKVLRRELAAKLKDVMQ